jgi:hypothetical protein
MLTRGFDTFGMSSLLMPKHAIATYCELRLEVDIMALLLQDGNGGGADVQLPPLACNLPLLVTLPLPDGQPPPAQTVRDAFRRRTLPRKQFVQRLEALARQQEERCEHYRVQLLAQLRTDRDCKMQTTVTLIKQELLEYGFGALDEALNRLADETAALLGDRGTFANLSSQLETTLTSQLRALDRVKQRLRQPLWGIIPSLQARRRRQALRLTQNITVLTLTMRLCRTLWQEDPLLRDFEVWVRSQRSRLQSVRECLVHRQQATKQALDDLTSRDLLLERAGRGVCLTERLKTQGYGLTDYYRLEVSHVRLLAREVTVQAATEAPEAVLHFLQEAVTRHKSEAVASLSLIGVLSQLDPTVRRQVLRDCVQDADVQLRIDSAFYVAHQLTPVKIRLCLVPGGQNSPVATWLKEIVAEPWEFVHRETDEEICFLVTGHRIMPEALIGHRLTREVFEQFPNPQWLQVLSDQALDASSRRLPAGANGSQTVARGTNNKVKMGSDSRPTGSASDPQ